MLNAAQTTAVNVAQVLSQNLTQEQLDAAQDLSNEVLCLACAGSGKSTTLAFRIARLISQGAKPENIVAFTFTEKAADSIKLRVAKALAAAGIDPTLIGAMYIGTIHSYCQRVLGDMDARYRQFEVLDENRLKLYLISRYSQLRLVQVRAAHGNAGYFETIKEVAEAWKIANDELVQLPDITSLEPDLGQALEALDARLDQDQFVDFSLMIRRVVEALRAGDANALRAIQDLRHLMVDEYQDVNPSQEELIRELRLRCSTLFVVGDDDQAIYNFRGADVSNILGFQQRYPNASVHALSRNFRSTDAIVAAADQFIAAELGPVRIYKTPQAEPYQGVRDFRDLWFPTQADEAQWVAERIQALLATAYTEKDGTVRGLTPADFAILMRSTKGKENDGTPHHLAFTQALTSRNIPYTLEAGGSVFDREQVRVLRDAFELLRSSSPNQQQALAYFTSDVLPAYPNADFASFTRVLSDWGRRVHSPRGGTRQRLRPQQLVHDLLNAFDIARTPFDDGTMQDIGVFSKMMQDVESVYVSIDSTTRFQEVLNFLQHVAETGYDSATTDVLSRPDTVTVSTVHKMKGLEFPVVFVVDVEANRFPKSNRRYRGWLPPQVIQPALARGAYQGTLAEEARLFYTALTRAERYLYVTGAQALPGGSRQRRPSPFSLRLAHPELSKDLGTLPTGLVPAAPSRRIDVTVVPTSFSAIRYYLRCPKDYQFRTLFGFSPSIPELFGFGKTVHTAISKLHERFPAKAPTEAEAEATARTTFHLKHVPPSGDPQNRPGAYERARDQAGKIVKTYTKGYAPEFKRRREVEWPFEVPVQQGMISGSIDLMLKYDGQGNILDANIIDFKAMKGPDPEEEQEKFHWTELALQVQLYAKAAREILGDPAYNGAVHFLKDDKRVLVPVQDDAVAAGVANVEWAIDRIVAADFPMRPHPQKCEVCDFRLLCAKQAQSFAAGTTPPPIHVPASSGSPTTEMVRAFSEFDDPAAGASTSTAGTTSP